MSVCRTVFELSAVAHAVFCALVVYFMSIYCYLQNPKKKRDYVYVCSHRLILYTPLKNDNLKVYGFFAQILEL